MTASGFELGSNVVRPIAIAGTESLEAYLRPLRSILSGEITELVINRPGEVWTESSRGWERIAAPELTYPHLRQLASLVAHATQQKVDEVMPRVSASLPTGERVEAIIPPAAESGTVSFTIRKPSHVRFTMDDYEAAGSFDQVVVNEKGLSDEQKALVQYLAEGSIRKFLELAVLSRQTILVSGATASGKTTIMKTLVDLIPPHERLITIEDTPELSLRQPNHVRLFYSSNSNNSLSKMTPGDLVRACMRMKPDRILPAELRDEAAYYFLAACNTGHPGSITSVHSNSARDALDRVATLARECDKASRMSDETLFNMVRKTIDVVIQFAKVGNRRLITGIYYDPAHSRSDLG